MYKLALLFSVLITLNANAKSSNDTDYLNYTTLDREQHRLEKSLFDKVEIINSAELDISTINIIELEEEVELGFDTANYLPKDFNALKGMHDLDWNTIELVEIEEDVEFDFNTKDYLPKNFNALKEMHDLDSHKFQLVLIEIKKELGYNLCSKN